LRSRGEERSQPEERTECEEWSSLGGQAREEGIAEEQEANDEGGHREPVALKDDEVDERADNSEAREADPGYFREDVMVTPGPRPKPGRESVTLAAVFAVEQRAEKASNGRNDRRPKPEGHCEHSTGREPPAPRSLHVTESVSTAVGPGFGKGFRHASSIGAAGRG
jgi:hypothetical protein